MKREFTGISIAGALGPDRVDVGWGDPASALDPLDPVALVAPADLAEADAAAAVM